MCETQVRVYACMYDVCVCTCVCAYMYVCTGFMPRVLHTCVYELVSNEYHYLGTLLKMGSYSNTTVCQYWDNRLIY